jgi:glycosyltransferase involved in cell wall biosynthesis
MSEAQKTLPGITVIIPVLNEEKHLAKTVQSVLNQKYSAAVEIILALGPSSDKTNQVASQLAAENKNIQLIDNPRGLTTVGLNASIAKAKHPVIVRIDAHSEPADN